MKVRLTDDNRGAIEAALRSAQSARMHVNTLDADDVLALIPDVNRRLTALLPLNAHKGARYTYCASGPSAKSYSYTQSATQIWAERGSEYWFLHRVMRVEVYPTQKMTDILSVDRGHASTILHRVMQEQGAIMIGEPQNMKRELTDVQAYIVDRFRNMGRHTLAANIQRSWEAGRGVIGAIPSEVDKTETAILESWIDLANFQATRDRGNAK